MVARSSSEAKFRAMACGTGELMWLRILLKEIGSFNSKPMILHYDNTTMEHTAKILFIMRS